MSQRSSNGDLEECQTELVKSIQRLASASRKRKLEQYTTSLAEGEAEIRRWLDSERIALEAKQSAAFEAAKQQLRTISKDLKYSVPKQQSIQLTARQLMHQSNKKLTQWTECLQRIEEAYKSAIENHEKELASLDKQFETHFKKLLSECEKSIGERRDEFRQLIKVCESCICLA